jgi:hypothetical protein
MAQQLLNLLAIVANQAAWDADADTNFTALKGALRTWKETISVQGNVGSPSTVTFQLQDANGENLSEQVYLRVRLTDSLTDFTVATNGSIAAGAGTTAVETLTSNKDIVFQSDASGLVTITYTNANAVTRYLMLAPSTLCPALGNYNNYKAVTHA